MLPPRTSRTAALHGLLGSRSPPSTPAAVPVQQLLPAQGTRARSALEWYRENVAMIPKARGEGGR